jgi:hypothetical protein
MMYEGKLNFIMVVKEQNVKDNNFKILPNEFKY